MTIYDYFRNTEPLRSISIVISFGYTLKGVYRGSLKNIPDMFKSKTAYRRHGYENDDTTFIYSHIEFTNDEMVFVRMMIENFHNLYSEVVLF